MPTGNDTGFVSRDTAQISGLDSGPRFITLMLHGAGTQGERGMSAGLLPKSTQKSLHNLDASQDVSKTTRLLPPAAAELPGALATPAGAAATNTVQQMNRLIAPAHSMSNASAWRCRGQLLASALLSTTPLIMIPVYYGSYLAGGPYGFNAANFPAGLEYLVLPIANSFVWIHGFVGLGSPDMQASQRRLTWYEKWATSSWISRLCCCAQTTDTSEQDLQIIINALPSKMLLFHFLGLYSLVLTLGLHPESYDGTTIVSALRAGLFNSTRAVTLVSLYFIHIVALWAAVQIRRGTLSVCAGRTDRMLVEFLHRFWLSMAVVIGIQVYNTFAFIQWYFRTLPARQAAVSNGAGVIGGSLAMHLEEVVFSLALPMLALVIFAAWYTIGSGLKMFENNASTNVQRVLVSFVGLTSMYGFAWAHSEMSSNESMFEFQNGTACTAECTFRDADPVLWFISGGHLTGGRPSWAQYWILMFIPVFILLGNDVRQKKNFRRKLQLPNGKKYHFFICHHQSSGGNQARILFDQLTALGCTVWYDMDQPLHERTLDGMKRGVRQSLTLLIFLSGRRERDGQPDVNGDYEGPFTRWFCHEEMGTALEAGLHIIGVMETDPRFGVPDIKLERVRALTGRNGRPVSARAHKNVKLLDEVCFLPRRTQQHELKGYLREIVRQGIEGAPHSKFRKIHSHPEFRNKGRESAALHRGTSDLQLKTVSKTMQDSFNLDLPAGKKFHFCICSHMSPSEPNNPADVLRRQLQEIGCKVAYLSPAAFTVSSPTADELETNVRGSICLLLFLTGTWRADGEYAGLFSCRACHEQIRIAKEAALVLVGVMVSEGQGRPDIDLEKETCTCGNENNLHLLDQLCFIPVRSQDHELEGFFGEILKQGLCPV